MAPNAPAGKLAQPEKIRAQNRKSRRECDEWYTRHQHRKPNPRWLEVWAKGDMLRKLGRRSAAGSAIVAAMVVAIWGSVWTEARSARGNPAAWPASGASEAAESTVAAQAGEQKTPSAASLDFKAQSAVIIDPETHKTTPLVLHQRVGDWTLMAVVQLPAADSAVGTAAGHETRGAAHVSRTTNRRLPGKRSRQSQVVVLQRIGLAAIL